MLKKLEQVLFFLTILLLPTQLGRHFWPDFSYIYSLRIDYLSPTIYLWDLLVVGLVVTFFLSQRKINKGALKLILLFLASQAVSLLPHLNEAGVLGVGLVRLEEYIFASLFGLYVASLDFSAVKKAVWLPLLLAISGEAALAITQFLTGGSLGLWILGERTFTLSTAGIAKFDFYGHQFLRPYGTFPHPNVLAAFMVITAVILTLNQVQGRSQIKSGMTRVGVMLAAIATLLTASRTAILTGILEGLFLLRRKWLGILIVGLVIVSPFLYTRYATLVNFDSLSLVRREELSIVALNLWRSSLFLGVGLNNFIPHSATDLLAGPSRFLQPVHNIYLLSLAETGIVGLMGLLYFVGYPMVRLLKKKPLLLVWASILFLGLFDHYFLTLPQGYRLLMLCWGISLSMLE